MLMSVYICIIPRFTDHGFDYDIALLKIRPVHGRGIVFNDYVQPACLPDVNTLYTEGNKCIISGWGLDKRGMYISTRMHGVFHLSY